MSDLFASSTATSADYDASSIEVLEGLEPVRRRPGMYIGGTDERALHHLAAEVLDNAMDEAVAGHATRIEVTLEAGNRLTVTDNGRGIPIDPHPKYPGKSALEVILTMLHSGGKFSNKAYATSAAFTASASAWSMRFPPRRWLRWRGQGTLPPGFARGEPVGPLEKIGATQNRRGTSVDLHARHRDFWRGCAV
jgi:topoisomerase-4 subunit B